MSKFELRRPIARDMVGCAIYRDVPTVHLHSTCVDLVKAFNHELRSRETSGAHEKSLRKDDRLRLSLPMSEGAKSLHGWFEAPVPHERARLRVMLCGVQEQLVVDGRGENITRGGLGFYAACFNPVQSWKLPGWPHPKTGVPTSLLVEGSEAGMSWNICRYAFAENGLPVLEL